LVLIIEQQNIKAHHYDVLFCSERKGLFYLGVSDAQIQPI
jgi:hypothetical protein